MKFQPFHVSNPSCTFCAAFRLVNVAIPRWNKIHYPSPHDNKMTLPKKQPSPVTRAFELDDRRLADPLVGASIGAAEGGEATGIPGVAVIAVG